MNKILIFLSFVIVMLSSSCNGAAKNDDSIVGVWKEYRTNDDDYLLSSWKFNSDGSGLFVVEGMTNTQKIAFTWKKTSSSEIEINANGETQTLEINNGLLIENGAFGTTVFKKQ